MGSSAATVCTGWPMAFGQLNGGRAHLPEKGALIIEFTDSLGRLWFGYLKSQLAVLGWRSGPRIRSERWPSSGRHLGDPRTRLGDLGWG